MVGRPLLDPARGAALLRLLGALVALLGLVQSSFQMCGFACGEYGQVAASGQNVATLAGVGPTWATVTLFRGELPAGVLVAELAVAVVSLVAVVALDVAAAAHLRPEPVCCDRP